MDGAHSCTTGINFKYYWHLHGKTTLRFYLHIKSLNYEVIWRSVFYFPGGLVSFRVRKPAESSYTKSAINIRFLTVDLNLGNGYDATTGIFTAPVNGLYLFFAQLCVGKGSNVYIQIWKNDTAIQTSRIYESGSHHCCNAEVVDGLMKGDQISLKSASGHTSTIAGDSDIYFNSFSGSLLRQGE